jgi:hypothetical protein
VAIPGDSPFSNKHTGVVDQNNQAVVIGPYFFGQLAYLVE